MVSVFIAYASGNKFHGQLIEQACREASTGERRLTPWSARDTSSLPIARSVESWIEGADAFIADVSIVNHNVTYEFGYAIGLQKPTRLIRSTQIDFKPVKTIALLDTLGYDGYDYNHVLKRVLAKRDETTKWGDGTKNKTQPIFILQPPAPTEATLRLTSAVKKIARIRFRNFNSAEISRLNASEAYEQVISSFGIVAFWMDGNGEEVQRNNQRTAFIYGVARGRNIPALLVAHEKSTLPLDLHDQADRWWKLDDLDKLVADFRLRVADVQNDFIRCGLITRSFSNASAAAIPSRRTRRLSWRTTFWRRINTGGRCRERRTFSSGARAAGRPPSSSRCEIVRGPTRRTS